MALSLLNPRSLRWRWLPPVALLIAAFHFSPFGPALDRAFFDAASRQPLVAPVLPDNSALVLVDESTLALLGREPYAMRWPFPRAAFAALITGLERAGAERIVMDFTFFEQAEAAEQDLLLGAVAAAVPGVVLGRTPAQGPVFWDEAFQKSHAALFAPPRMGNVEFQPDADGIARHYQAPGSLAAAALGATETASGGWLRWHGGLEQLRAQGVPVVPAAHFFAAGLPVLDRISQESPDFLPAELAAALAAEPELHGGAFDLVRGRTVFVGANAAGTFDLKSLPVGQVEPGVLLHWTAWANLTGRGFITPIGPGYALALAGLLVAGLLVTVQRRPGLTAPAVVALSAIGLLPALAYAGISAGWFFPPATPTIAALLTLLGVAAESFWLEQRRKREIQTMFGAYVDPGVVARLVRDPDSLRLGGERREATVFFSDLAGFTDLSEKLPPEELVEVVNAYLEETSECLLNHGAYVDKYIGDAVMAVFGAPQTLPDHALAACRAALDAQRLLDGINTRYAAAGVRLAVRIGLNTGSMIVGNLGSSRKKNYTVMGDAVNLASRLEGANKAFGTGILIGEETARRVQGALATRPLARLRVKGKQQAVEVHTLHGVFAELPAQEQEFLAHYRRGYDAYVAGEFATACAALAEAALIAPGDLTTARLREESQRFMLNPPPDDWEPILTLESK